MLKVESLSSSINLSENESCTSNHLVLELHNYIILVWLIKGNWYQLKLSLKLVVLFSYVTLVQDGKLLNLVITARPRRTTVGPGRLQLDQADYSLTRRTKV